MMRERASRLLKAKLDSKEALRYDYTDALRLAKKGD
jgi:hypothetical protein